MNLLLPVVLLSDGIGIPLLFASVFYDLLDYSVTHRHLPILTL